LYRCIISSGYLPVNPGGALEPLRDSEDATPGMGSLGTKLLLWQKTAQGDWRGLILFGFFHWFAAV